MRYLIIVLLVLGFGLIGCSDDTDTPADAGTDVVMEASVDAEAPVEASVDAEPVEEAGTDAEPADSSTPEDTAPVEAAAGD